MAAADRWGRCRSRYQQRQRSAAAGGAIIGDLPPYEAFPIGGTNSVRGYSEGGVGTGRHYAVGTAEVHWSLPLSFLEARAAQLAGDPASAAGHRV